MSESITAYTCTPRQIRRFIIRCMKARRVPFIKSSPAMGKSALVSSVADEYTLKMLDHRLSTSTPEDLSGLPHFENGKASFVPFDMFPTEDMEVPEGYNGWLLFLDEFNSCSKAVQAAAYKLVLDRMVGQKKLHPRVLIVCAGNLSSDRAIVNPIGTAMQSRLIHLKMVLDFDEFMQDVALPQKWDNRIIAYLSYKRANLHDFRPDHQDETFCSPRTWEFMNDLIQGEEVRAEDAALYAGTITSGIAVDFITFTKVFNSLPKLKDIIQDPHGTDVPVESGTRWATITMLLENVDDDNYDQISTYIDRMSAEFRVLFFRGLIAQKPHLKQHQAFRKSAVQLSRYLHDDDIPAVAA